MAANVYVEANYLSLAPFSLFPSGVAYPGAAPESLHDGGSQGDVATGLELEGAAGEKGRTVANAGEQLGRATGGVLSALPEPVRRNSGFVHVCFQGGAGEWWCWWW